MTNSGSRVSGCCHLLGTDKDQALSPRRFHSALSKCPFLSDYIDHDVSLSDSLPGPRLPYAASARHLALGEYRDSNLIEV